MEHVEQLERLIVEGTLRQAELYESSVGTLAVFSTRSPCKETANEDAAAIVPFDDRSVVLAVADGMGGVRGGDIASRLAIETLRDTLAKSRNNGQSMRSGILNGIENANRAVLDLGLGAATTIVVVEIEGRVIRPYHVGDSLALLVGQRGKIKAQTVSHSPVGFAVEAGLLEEHEAMHHEDRHLISNAIGALDMRIEMGATRKLAALDTLLLASDGLSDNLWTSEIVERIRKGDLSESAQRLVDDVSQRMTGGDKSHPSKPDDLTFILFRPAH